MCNKKDKLVHILDTLFTLFTLFYTFLGKKRYQKTEMKKHKYLKIS
jgi:hypothetical protein